MNLRHGLLLAVFVAGGCASVDQPMTAGEYREAFRKNGWPTQTFNVNRPHAQVSAILRRRAGECLAVTVEKTVYKPTVTVAKEGTALAVRRGTGGGNYNYVFLADATPATRTSTAVTIYPAGGGGMEIGAALRAWARGDNMSCPDLTKVH